jgi:5-epimerase
VEIRELAVEGALEFTPSTYPDERGLFVAPFQGPALAQARGQDTFPVRQAN